MRVEIRNRTSDFDSYRAARVKSLFNAESGCNFDLDAELPLEEGGWKIGVVVGPSGSGKSSIGRAIWEGDAFWAPAWPADRPIIDAIAPGGDFNEVTGALAAVGLGSVPSWLRPFPILSMGEQFRASLARLICERPARAVVDEFTSVVDRQIARMGALAFQKAWRRGPGQVVLLSCHYDVLEWLEPDWVFDTATRTFTRGGLRRPPFDLELWETDSRYWPLFAPHYYLTLPKMIGAKYYVGTVDGELVAHVAVATKNVGKGVEARASRLVVMPEWQGAGVGLRFLNAVAELQLKGEGRLPGRSLTTIFHTSHPGLCAALRRDPRWAQVSAALYGGNRAKSAKSIHRSQVLARGKTLTGDSAGFGGHFRAIQGFRYLGELRAKAAIASAGRTK